jgi:hypothetical protein
MAEPDKQPVTCEELLVSSLAQTDALAKLLIEKGLITREEFMHTTTLRGSSNTQGLFGSSLVHAFHLLDSGG